MDEKTMPEQATHYRINATEAQTPVTQAEMDQAIDRLTGIRGGEEMRRKIATKKLSKRELREFADRVANLPKLNDPNKMSDRIFLGIAVVSLGLLLISLITACLKEQMKMEKEPLELLILALMGLSFSGIGVHLFDSDGSKIKNRLGKTPADLVRSRLSARSTASRNVRQGVVSGVLSKLEKWMKDKTRVAEFRERVERAHERMRLADVKWCEELNRQAAEIETVASLVNHVQAHDLQNARALLERINAFADRLERVEQMTHSGIILSREDFPDENKLQNIEALLDQVESALPSSTPSVRIDASEDEDADDDSSSSYQAFQKVAAP